MTNTEKKDVAENKPVEQAASTDAPPSESAKPLQVNRTIQLDVGQVDLLDVPLPPSSNPNVGDTSSTSKGPPPLPPSLPPEPTPAPVASPVAAPVAVPGAGVHNVNARALLEAAPAAPNPMLRFALGLGVATLICAGLWFGLRALRKTPAPPQPPISSANAPAPSAAPIRTITIAPIEMTGPALSASEDRPAASATPTSTSTAKPSAGGAAATSHTSPAGSIKPRGNDDVIKVEN